MITKVLTSILHTLYVMLRNQLMLVMVFAMKSTTLKSVAMMVATAALSTKMTIWEMGFVMQEFSTQLLACMIMVTVMTCMVNSLLVLITTMQLFLVTQANRLS